MAAFKSSSLIPSGFDIRKMCLPITLILAFTIFAALPRDLRVLAVSRLVADCCCEQHVVAPGTAVFHSPERFRRPAGFRFRVFVHCVSGGAVVGSNRHSPLVALS